MAAMSSYSPSSKRAKIDKTDDIDNVASTIATTSTPKAMAYLGPQGTYGEQAAKSFASRLDHPVNLIPCPNISSIYSHPAEYLVMPLENTLHGSVTETIDCLLSCLKPTPYSSSVGANAEAGPSRLPHPRVVADTSLLIDHYLIALRGVPLTSIEWVRSHEQALGQSALYLDTHLPNAARVSWPSTAGAVASLLEDNDDEDQRRKGAAIASKAAYEANSDKLDVLKRGTQAVQDNYTRFLLLTRSPQITAVNPEGNDELSSLTQVSFYVCPVPAQIGHLAKKGTLLAVHPRPAPAGLGTGTFPRWTLIELNPVSEGAEEDTGGHILLGSFESSIV